MRQKLFFFILIFFLSILVTLIFFTIWANNKISKEIEFFIYSDLSKVPNNKTGLILGTAKYLKNGYKNEYFFNRIDAAVELYNSGKISYIIVSGDNSRKDYDESSDMMSELVERGIPRDNIFLDYAGFRTLDSVIRAKEIFDQNSFIVISQKFHNERAVFLARKYGLSVFGYNAKDVSHKSYKTKIREVFARDKVFFDLLFNIEPRFYGEKIIIP